MGLVIWLLDGGALGRVHGAALFWQFHAQWPGSPHKKQFSWLEKGGLEASSATVFFSGCSACVVRHLRNN